MIQASKEGEEFALCAWVEVKTSGLICAQTHKLSRVEASSETI